MCPHEHRDPGRRGAADGAAADVWLGDLVHGDRGHDPGGDTGSLEGVLERQAVHDRGQHADARRYAQLDYADLLRDQLKVLDATAVSLCMENDLPIVVFDLNRPDNITRVAAGEAVGTLISGASSAGGGAPA